MVLTRLTLCVYSVSMRFYRWCDGKLAALEIKRRWQ